MRGLLLILGALMPGAACAKDLRLEAANADAGVDNTDRWCSRTLVEVSNERIAAPAFDPGALEFKLSDGTLVGLGYVSCAMTANGTKDASHEYVRYENLLLTPKYPRVSPNPHEADIDKDAKVLITRWEDTETLLAPVSLSDFFEKAYPIVKSASATGMVRQHTASVVLFRVTDDGPFPGVATEIQPPLHWVDTMTSDAGSAPNTFFVYAESPQPVRRRRIHQLYELCSFPPVDLVHLRGVHFNLYSFLNANGVDGWVYARADTQNHAIAVADDIERNPLPLDLSVPVGAEILGTYCTQ